MILIENLSTYVTHMHVGKKVFSENHGKKI